MGSVINIYVETFLKDCGNDKDFFWEFHNLDHLNWRSVDYLTFHHRPKWHDNKQQYAVNDIVIIQEDNKPSMLWPLAGTN